MLKKINKQSLLNLVFITIGLIGFIMLLYARSDIVISDTAWHIKVGEWILNNKSIPKYDSFSLLSSNLELKFMAHEWLFGIFLYWIDNLFSVNGLIIITTLAIFVSYMFAIIKSKSLVPSLVVSSLFIFFQFVSNISCRPSAFTSILIVYSGYVFAYEQNKIKKYIISILSLIFLANFHGGFVTLALIQFFWISICKFIVNKKIDKDTLLLLGTSVLSTFCNPYGIGIHKYIFIISKSISMYNTDYSPLSFSNIFQLGVVLLIVILSIVGYTKSKEKNIFDLCIMFMYLAMVFYYKKTLDMFNYAFIIYMCKYLNWLFNKQIIKKIGYGIVSISSIGLFILVLTHEKLPNKSTEDYIREDIIGENVVEALHNTRFYNTMGSGGYLIYLNEKPFQDTRNDIYSKEFGNPNLLEDGIKAAHSDTLMYNLTTKYDLEYLLLEKNSICSQIFYASRFWEVEEESKYYILFKKTH